MQGNFKTTSCIEGGLSTARQLSVRYMAAITLHRPRSRLQRALGAVCLGLFVVSLAPASALASPVQEVGCAAHEHVGHDSADTPPVGERQVREAPANACPHCPTGQCDAMAPCSEGSVNAALLESSSPAHRNSERTTVFTPNAGPRSIIIQHSTPPPKPLA